MFSELVVAYLFFGGTGAGACVVLGLLECANIGRYGVLPAPAMPGPGRRGRRRSLGARFLVPHELMARGWAVCLLLLAAGALCLAADLGRPERILALWVSPRPSVVTLGAWALLAALAVAAFLAAASNAGCPRMSPAVVLALSVAAVAAGSVTAAYTGVLLGSLPSVVAFGTVLVPVLFVLSSLSCGVAVVFGAASFVDSRSSFAGALRRLARLDGILVVTEAVALALFAARLVSLPAMQEGARALLEGEGAVLFWVVLVLGGLVAPLVLERRYPLGDRRVKGLWIAFCVLMGGAALRVCVTGLAAFDVSQVPELAFGMALAAGS